MRIKEVGSKAENLIEIGNAAEEKKNKIINNIHSAQQQVNSAQYALEQASETDENGDTVGDISYAQAELDAAMLDLEYYEDELEQIEKEIEGIKEEKIETVHTLEEYTAGESSNLEILKQLQSKKFGGNVGAMVAAIISQMNLSENIKNDLLNSLGMSGSTTNISAGSQGGVNQILSSPDYARTGVKNQCIGLLRSKKSSFSASQWSKLSSSQRADALNGLAIDAGNAMRIDIKGVKFYDGPRSSRGYFNNDGYLHLNSDVLYDETQREDALDTIFHEGRHAFQRAAIDDPEKYGVSPETAEEWRNNQPPNNYIRYEEDPIGYMEQPVEKDAFSFAGSVIEEGLK